MMCLFSVHWSKANQSPWRGYVENYRETMIDMCGNVKTKKNMLHLSSGVCVCIEIETYKLLVCVACELYITRHLKQIKTVLKSPLTAREVKADLFAFTFEAVIAKSTGAGDNGEVGINRGRS